MKRTDELINKVILVGLTYVDEYGEIVERKSFYGRIALITDEYIQVSIRDSQDVFKLPPDLSAIKEAPKGEYHIYATGDIVKNPDYISNWIIKCN